MFKNPIIFMILIEKMGIIVTIIETVHLKTNYVDTASTSDGLDVTIQNFRMTLVILTLIIVRLALLIGSECYRVRYYSSRVEIKHNIQVIILILRSLFNVVIILPFIVYC